MISKTQPSRPLPEADMAACVAYVDGDLSPEAQLAFEQRLASEPELAAATEALLDADRLLRGIHRDTVQRVAEVRRMRPWLWGGSLAVAAALLTALAVHLLTPGPRIAKFRVALAPGFESSADFVASVPELEGLRPAGLDVLRGAGDQPNIAASDFAAKAHAAEEQLASTALGASTSQLESGYFVVPVELARAGDVVIYVVPEKGRGDESIAASFAASLTEGRHVLPSERFALDGVTLASVRYERGFLVPVGAGALEVVLGVRDHANAALEAPRIKGADDAQHSLERLGFTVRRLRVREPAN